MPFNFSGILTAKIKRRVSFEYYSNNDEVNGGLFSTIDTNTDDPKVQTAIAPSYGGITIVYSILQKTDI